MFLAWKEIKYNKFRYTLIISVLFLIAYLVFFLVGLANGLSQQNKTAITAWNSDGIVVTKESNENISASLFDAEWAKDVIADEKANLLQVATSITFEDTDKLTSIRVFGIEEGAFIEPAIISGEKATDLYEIVVDKFLQRKFGLELGDTIEISNYDTPLKIVGFTKNQSLNVAPVIFANMDTAFDLSRNKNTMNKEMSNAMPKVLSAIIVKQKDHNVNSVILENEFLEVIEIDEFINALPGYTAQRLTFFLMIFFLVLIGAIVAGIFIYVLTMQKQQIFGVMKAQGISNSFIIKSVVIQTAILACIGVGSGLIITLMTATVLPVTVPFALDIKSLMSIGGLMVICATTGGLFSSRSIIKVDPLKAIS